MLLTVTTTGKVTLLIVAGAFIAWALITAIWIPKRNAEFPATLTAFILVSSLFLVAQLGAVSWVTSTQEVETEAVGGEAGGGATVPAEPGSGVTTPGEAATGATTTGDTTTGATTTGATTTGETPQAGGDAEVVAGKQIFASAGCATCHTLGDAGSTGTVGPNLDQVKPPSALVVKRVTNGQGVMPPFKGQLTEQQIQDVAAYVSSVAGSK